MRKIIPFAVFFIISSPLLASEQVFGFKNPSFSGEGFSSHALTIENLEFNRKQAIKQQEQAAMDAIATAAKNTNLSKFLNNLESRIYAQLSLQMSNAMFSDGSTSGSMNFEGTTISWIKDVTTNMIKLTMIDPTGNRTEISVPIGSFKF
jgi:Type VIII secretion system (T8SS), CsgF protein